MIVFINLNILWKLAMRFIITLIFLILHQASFAQQKITVDYTWKLAHKCGKISPEITVSGIPTGSTELSVKMIDLDYRAADSFHGGGFIKDDAGFPDQFTIAEASLKSFGGPCPPNFTSHGHDYEITVIAKDKNNQILGKGSVVKTFAAKTVKE